MTMSASMAREAQKLATDALVKLYTLDLTAQGGSLYRFISSIDSMSNIVSITSAATLATCITETPHTLLTGDAVRVAGATPDGYNGDHSVTVIDSHTFTYNMFTSVGDAAHGDYMKIFRLNGLVKWDSHLYTPIAFEATGFEWNGQGSLPNPKIRLSNVNRVFLASVISLRDAVGGTFTRYRVFRKNLDDGVEPDPTLYLPIEVYRVNRKSVHNKVFLEFELAAAIDQQGVKIPGRQCLKRTCGLRYRVWNPTTLTFNYSKATCPYTGAPMFTNRDIATADSASDHCSKLLTGCTARFGSAALPFGGFPGVGG